MSRKVFFAFFCGLCILPGLFTAGSVPVHAQSQLEQLQADIKDRNSRLDQIQKEIAKYESALKEVGAQKSTLTSAIAKLELERGKVQADIKYTEQKITSTDLQLSKLLLEISAAEKDIDTNKQAMAEIIRNVYQTNSESMIEVMLHHDHFSEVWNAVDTLQSVRNGLASRVSNLHELENTLAGKRDETESRRSELVGLKSQYTDQNAVLVQTKADRTQLLSATKNEEANYQKLLKQQKAAKDQIEKEMRDFEAKLKFILDPSSIPAAGTAVFSWPLDKVIITQFFGGTEFAKRNAAVYGGRAYHPGIDMGTPVGTPIHAPLSGTVRATGNTDAVPGCYSWGKWTLIDHANGLSTLYAHQSVQSVTPGQHVNTGDIIGYSGNTGYSTGPHLHFTVYAKDGVSVRPFNQIKAVTSCGAATTPVAATDAYLDPLLYLPKYGG
jgi:murein DD-endopeptidase MepM/ murein hydrolase activator NlpD